MVHPMPLQLLRFKRRARIAIRLGILAITLRLLKQITGFIAPSERACRLLTAQLTKSCVLWVVLNWTAVTKD
nr:MAG TPA: hypothetical protein [Caudoviricetes sp.]